MADISSQASKAAAVENAPSAAVLAFEKNQILNLQNGNPLARRVKITSGMRFLAAERLKRTESISLLTISLLTGYIIIASAGQVILDDVLKELANQIITFGVIGLSILVLIISLTEAKSRATISASHLERNAQAIHGIHSEIVSLAGLGILTKEKYMEFEGRYRSLLTSDIYNQASIDFDTYIDKNIVLYPEYSKNPMRSVVKARAIFAVIRNYFMYYFAIFGFPIFLVIVLIFCRDQIFKIKPV